MHFLSLLQASILRAVTRPPFEVLLEQKAAIVSSSQHGRDQTLPLQCGSFCCCCFVLMVVGEGVAI